MSDRITLSIFLFLEKHHELSFKWLEEAFGFSCRSYDEDKCEMGGSDSWSLIPLGSALRPMSWSEHWADQALLRAKELGIEQCRRALLVPWDKYEPRGFKRKKPRDPIIIGPFEFADPDVL